MSTFLTFILGAKLDREYIDQYAFKVVALDGGGGLSDEPPRKTEVAVTVRLEDINDNVPKFERDSYSIEFSEDAKIGKDGDTNSGKFLHPPTHCLLSANFQRVSLNDDNRTGLNCPSAT